MIAQTERSADCPGHDVLLGYLHGRLPEDEAEAFEAHYFACDACWRELEGAMALGASLGDVAVEPRGTRTARWRGWLALAAAGLVAVGIWIFGAVAPDSEPPALRGEQGALALQVEPRDGRFLLRWPEVRGADVYLLQAYGEDGELLLERESSESSVSLAASELPAGHPVVFFRVRALDDLRQSIVSSELEELNVRPAERPR